MKSSIYIFIILGITGIISCAPAKKESRSYPRLDPGAVFVKKDPLKGEYLQYTLISPYSLFLTQYGLGYVVSKGENGILHMVDTVTAKEIATCGRRGRGPGEFMGFICYNYDWHKSRLFAADVYKQELWNFLFSEDSIRQCGYEKLGRDYKALAALNDSVYVYLTFYPNQVFGMMTRRSKNLSSIPYRIINREDIDYASFGFSCAMRLTPDKSKAVLIGSTYASLQVYSITGRNIELECDYPYFDHMYEIRDGQPYALDENVNGGESSCVTDKNIYVLSYGKTVGDETPVTGSYILVFNMRGEYLKTYYIDRRVYSIAVSQDDKTLYATTVKDLDVYLMKFRL